MILSMGTAWGSSPVAFLPIMLLTEVFLSNSDPGRDCEFRCVCFRASNFSNAFGCIECVGWVRCAMLPHTGLLD